MTKMSKAVFRPSRREFLLLTGIASLATALPPSRGADKFALKGETFYALVNFYAEDGKHYTTNYRKGTLYPVNTQVTFVSGGGDNFVLTAADGSKIEVENVQKYSGENLAACFKRMFGKEKVDLARFSDLEKKGIESADAVEGMSKDAVIVALGYPPKHQTPSLNSDRWRYWKNRFGTFVVTFKDNKVSGVEK